MGRRINSAALRPRRLIAPQSSCRFAQSRKDFSRSRMRARRLVRGEDYPSHQPQLSQPPAPSLPAPIGAWIPIVAARISPPDPVRIRTPAMRVPTVMVPIDLRDIIQLRLYAGKRCNRRSTRGPRCDYANHHRDCERASSAFHVHLLLAPPARLGVQKNSAASLGTS